MTEPEHAARNRASTERLARVVPRVRDGVDVDDGWTAAALLSHVAFWDRVARSRWEHGRSFIDRSTHRNEHLDQIECALG